MIEWGPILADMHLTRQRTTLRILIKNHGLRIVAAAIGIDPATLARFQAGQRLARRTQAAVDRALAQSPHLHLSPEHDRAGVTPREMAPPPTKPRLRLVHDALEEGVEAP